MNTVVLQFSQCSKGYFPCENEFNFIPKLVFVFAF